jgi:hypothetical protein
MRGPVARHSNNKKAGTHCWIVDAFLKEEPIGFFEEVAAVCEGRRGVMFTPRFHPQQLKDGVTISWNKENRIEIWLRK